MDINCSDVITLDIIIIKVISLFLEHMQVSLQDRGQTWPQGKGFPQGRVQPPSGAADWRSSGLQTIFIVVGWFLHTMGNPWPTRFDCRSSFITVGQIPCSAWAMTPAFPMRNIPCCARDNSTLVRLRDLRKPTDPTISLSSNSASLRTREIRTILDSLP